MGQAASTRTCRRGALSLGWTATCMRTTWCPPATTPCSARWALPHHSECKTLGGGLPAGAQERGQPSHRSYAGSCWTTVCQHPAGGPLLLLARCHLHASSFTLACAAPLLRLSSSASPYPLTACGACVQLIVWAPTREKAIQRMQRALSDTVIDGQPPPHLVCIGRPSAPSLPHPLLEMTCMCFFSLGNQFELLLLSRTRGIRSRSHSSLALPSGCPPSIESGVRCRPPLSLPRAPPG